MKCRNGNRVSTSIWSKEQLLESVVQQNGNLCEPTKRKMEGMGAQECPIDV